MAYYLSKDLRHTLVGGLRGFFRLLYFTAVFVASSLVALLARAVLPGATYRAIRPDLARTLGRVVTYASNVRVRRKGTAPPPGAFIVANHLSWADSFTFLGELGCRFMANHLYGEIVGFGTVLRSIGVEFMNRMSLKAIGPARAAVRRMIARGESLVVFPEGRTSRGEQVRRFRAALLQTAVDLGIPVASAAVTYETPAGWPPASVVIGWEEWPPLITHIYRAFHAPRIICRIRFGSRDVAATDRRSLASRLHRAVSGLFEPMPQLSPEELQRIDVGRRLSRPIVYGQEPDEHERA